MKISDLSQFLHWERFYEEKLSHEKVQAKIGITLANIRKSLRDFIRQPFGRIFLMKNLGLYLMF
jgi:hypothetical protein